jgi:hypothetical protein
MTALKWVVPGSRWVPPVLRSAHYWRTVGRFALWGPLIGGSPYAVFIITIPFIYLLGLAPAVLAGMLFAAWVLAPGRRYPSAGWRAIVGMFSGAVACASIALVVASRNPLMPWAFLAVHGIPAALLLALTQKQFPGRITARAQEPHIEWPKPKAP